MKQFHLSLLFLALLFTGCSFDFVSTTPDGLWDEMKLSKKEMHFGPKGGTDTISVKNYSSWWFSSACDGDCTNNIYILPDTLETGYPDIHNINGGWWKGKILEDSPNKAVITVDSLETCESEECDQKTTSRKAVITMTAGDIFSSIIIYQEKNLVP